MITLDNLPVVENKYKKLCVQVTDGKTVMRFESHLIKVDEVLTEKSILEYLNYIEGFRIFITKNILVFDSNDKVIAIQKGDTVSHS